MLELKELTKSYKSGNLFKTVLKKINIKFRKNEFVSILGPSGSGKTTLLNIIGGLDGYDSGDLVINGVSTKKFKESKWDSYRNNCVGFIFQNYNLIGHVSVLQNVEMSMTLSGVKPKEKRRRALKALHDVGLKDHVYKKPNQLSGGQMQRVAIARAIVNNPEVILADEPTGALDSKTSIQIMNLIKSVAKDKLVIMVTHNASLAKEYSERIIELKDGVIINDTKPYSSNDADKNAFSIKKTSMSFLTALRLSLNNIFTKKGRTILTSFASSIGIIGILIILSLSNGFDDQIDKFERDTMSSFPISIPQVVSTISEDNVSESKEFSKEKVLYPCVQEENNSVHENKITGDYVKYINNIDKSLVSGISYDRITNFNILYKGISGVKALSGNDLSFTSLPNSYNNENYLMDNYDLLYGNYPSNYNDVVLIVDSDNHVDKSLLKLLEIDIKDKIDFDELVNKEFKLVNNDDFYTSLGNDLFMINEDLDKTYDLASNLTLKITGIIRVKEDNKLGSITNTLSKVVDNKSVKIGYLDDLIKYIVNNNKGSKIVKAQENANGVVFIGNVPFKDTSITKSQVLTMLGKDDVPLSINIYPNDFNDKEKIIKYLDKYNDDKKEDEKIIYTDYAREFSLVSGNIMDAVTIILVTFSSISLIVSSFMIGIITYISVVERTKEIGILRSLGARRKDITRVFNAETFIIGFTSGLIGVLITRLLIIPINVILNNLTGLAKTAKMSPYHALILVIVSILLTLISGFIPAKMASKKNPVVALRTD